MSMRHAVRCFFVLAGLAMAPSLSWAVALLPPMQETASGSNESSGGGGGFTPANSSGSGCRWLTLGYPCASNADGSTRSCFYVTQICTKSSNSGTPSGSKTGLAQ